MVLIGVLVVVYCAQKGKTMNLKPAADAFAWGRIGKVFFCFFWILFAVQILGLVFLSFSDGDDSYYVAVATIAIIGTLDRVGREELADREGNVAENGTRVLGAAASGAA